MSVPNRLTIAVIGGAVALAFCSGAIAQARGGGPGGARAGGPGDAAAAASRPTPRMADGHPNLTAMWRVAPAAGGRRGGSFQVFGNAGAAEGGGQETAVATRDGNMNYIEIDAEFSGKAGQEVPLYKPESWQRVRDLEEFAFRRPADPGYGCRNPGVVRLGSPAEIVHLPNKVILLYSGDHLWVREIPTDGRPLPKEEDYEGARITGFSSGQWEGDELVVVTVDFPADMVWYGNRGWFSSAGTKITERFRRTGDQMTYNVTVDDPAFLRPWVRPTATLLAGNDPAALLQNPTPCLDRDGAFLPPSS